jgi:TM2 domain-containing membrane protein YozV
MVHGASAIARTTKDRNTAGILGLLLGGIGVHKFYLGQTGLGILYLLFFWTMIPAIAGFIEGIILLTMSDEAFAQKYPG